MERCPEPTCCGSNEVYGVQTNVYQKGAANPIQRGAVLNYQCWQTAEVKVLMGRSFLSIQSVRVLRRCPVRSDGKIISQAFLNGAANPRNT